MVFKGTGASPGIALGKALIVEHSELVIEKKSIENVDIEIKRLHDAVKNIKRRID